MGIEHGGDEEQQKRAELTRGFKVTLRKHLLKNKSTNRQKEKKTLNWKSFKLFEQECASAGTSQDNFRPCLFVCLSLHKSYLQFVKVQFNKWTTSWINIHIKSYHTFGVYCVGIEIYIYVFFWLFSFYFQSKFVEQQLEKLKPAPKPRTNPPNWILLLGVREA